MEIIKISDNGQNVALTVALPCYKAKKIGWLCLESLCNQINITFNWELLICEEVHDLMLGSDFFAQYTERLREAGCIRVTYIKLDSWVNLPSKWAILGQEANKSSKAFVLQAIDCYAPSRRLELTYQAIVKEKFDWVDFTKGYFYSFHFDKIIQYDAKAKTNLHMAFNTQYARTIPFTAKNKGIDGFLYDHILSYKGEVRHKTINHLYTDGIDTDGHNNISIKRVNFYSETKYPFIPSNVRIENTSLPAYVVSRIRRMKNN